MNIVILDQDRFYASGLKQLINECLSQSATIAINNKSLLNKAHLVIRTPALSNWEELQGAFNHPQTLYIYPRPLPDEQLSRNNALYRNAPLTITLSVLQQHLNQCLDEVPTSPTIKSSLSSAEIRLLKMLKKGWPDNLIADRFQLSTKSISLRRSNAMKKMGLRNRLELYQLLNKLQF